jgi:hypothetical protein
VLCPRSASSTKRFIRFLRKSQRNHIVGIKLGDAFSHNLGHQLPRRALNRADRYLIRMTCQIVQRSAGVAGRSVLNLEDRFGGIAPRSVSLHN